MSPQPKAPPHRPTSAPWATPTSPAGVRLLQSEPATLDAIPVMTLAEMESALRHRPAAHRPTSAGEVASGDRCRSHRTRAFRGWLAVAALVLVVGGGATVATGPGSVVGDAAASVARPFDGEPARTPDAAPDGGPALARVDGVQGREDPAGGSGGVVAQARSVASGGSSPVSAAVTLDGVAGAPTVGRVAGASAEARSWPTLRRRAERLGAMAAGLLGPHPVPSDRLVDPATG